MSIHLKPILAVSLCICLLNMPYGYYTLVRFVAAVLCGFFSFEYSQQKKQGLMITFGALALLFQPFIKIALGREIWNIIDVFLAILLLVLWWKEYKAQKQ